MSPARQPPGESDGAWIRRGRDEVGFTQEQLAHAAEVGLRSVKDYEAGRTLPPSPKRVAIEQALRRRREELGYESTVERAVRRLEEINLEILELVGETLIELRRRLPPATGEAPPASR